MGPIVAVISFVCSIGNVPLAAVLWNGGISFGGVVAFIFAALIILPILNIYRKYYGWKMAAFLAAALLIRFFTTGGVAMLKMMGGNPDAAAHDHHGTHEHGSHEHAAQDGAAHPDGGHHDHDHAAAPVDHTMRSVGAR
jgi:uncharacterized protein